MENMFGTSKVAENWEVNFPLSKNVRAFKSLSVSEKMHKYQHVSTSTNLIKSECVDSTVLITFISDLSVTCVLNNVGVVIVNAGA